MPPPHTQTAPLAWSESERELTSLALKGPAAGRPDSRRAKVQFVVVSCGLLCWRGWTASAVKTLLVRSGSCSDREQSLWVLVVPVEGRLASKEGAQFDKEEHGLEQ